jgi:F420H(2)-dependent quinone reductase
MANQPPPKFVVKLFSRFNVWVYRLSGGRLMNTMLGKPICLVTMTGRKSGQAITQPLMYVPHGREVLLVASLGGAPKHPVWYHNLVATPRVTIQVGSERRAMTVRQASPEEKQALWPVCVAAYPEYATYQTLTERDIPVMVCSPAG